MDRKLLLNSGIIKEMTGKTFGMIGLTINHDSEEANGVFLTLESIGNAVDLLELLISREILPSNFNLNDYQVFSTSDESELYFEGTFFQVEFVNIHNSELSFLIDYYEKEEELLIMKKMVKVIDYSVIKLEEIDEILGTYEIYEIDNIYNIGEYEREYFESFSTTLEFLQEIGYLRKDLTENDIFVDWNVSGEFMEEIWDKVEEIPVCRIEFYEE